MVAASSNHTPDRTPSLDTQVTVVDVQVFLRGSGDTETYSGPAIIQDGEVVFLHDLTSQPLRAFSDVEYWFRISPENGEPFQSDTYTFYYEDNRFSWQTLSSGPFSVHWYEGTTEFAQSVLNAAEAGLERAKTLLKLPLVQAVDIYVYASGMEMQSTLRLGGLRWIAGHADPDLGVAVVSLPTGPYQRSEIERQIPHEVMHLLLYQLTGASYYSLPIWLKEGLASANETRPNPDYYVILSSAVEKDTLIPMAFGNYLPVRYLLGKGGSPWVLLLAPVVGVLALWLAYRLWLVGETRYQSTGS